MMLNVFFRMVGYLGMALQTAYYELLNGSSFEQSLVDIMERGGDTDTNGCIAGNSRSFSFLVKL